MRWKRLECWQIAIGHKGPSVLALTRQNVPQASPAHDRAIAARRARYEIVPGMQQGLRLDLATGSEVAIASPPDNSSRAGRRRPRRLGARAFELFPRAARRGRAPPLMRHAPVRLGVEAADAPRLG